MKLISLWEPWASLMAHKLKQYETRHWETSYRGLLGIHAAKRKLTKQQWAEFWEQVNRFGAADQVRPICEDLQYGKLVAIVTMDNCLLMGPHSNPRMIAIDSVSPLERATGNWTKGRFAWQTSNVLKLPEPIPTRGYQSLWDATPETIEQIHKQTGMTI